MPPLFEHDPENLDTWQSPDFTWKILGQDAGVVHVAAAKICAGRIRRLIAEFEKSYAGMSDHEFGPIGNLFFWIFATLVGRENLLFLGEPGVGKSEIATRIFRWLGLSAPGEHFQNSGGIDPILQEALKETRPEAFFDLWKKRVAHERNIPKFFHFLLSRFTQPEELFGPIEIGLLTKGIHARINFGQATGPGVFAIFLDEVFKATSPILNTLLTLTQERTYFNFGGMVKSDLQFLIAASNEMPGRHFAGGDDGGHSLQALHAFLDRFPVRLLIPSLSPVRLENDTPSDFENAATLATNRESARLCKGDQFADSNLQIACINDLLLLGRFCMQHRTFTPVELNGHIGFEPADLHTFWDNFIEAERKLKLEQTSPAQGQARWTMSPRKHKALYKVALAHALLSNDDFTQDDGERCKPDTADLAVFLTIWDSFTSRRDLYETIKKDLEPRGTGA